MNRPPWRPLAERIARGHGTWRGALRGLLARLELGCGRLRRFQLRDPYRVRRLVFVCQGNICRSAFAGQVAQWLALESASLGLATTSGACPPDAAVAAARRQGYDLRAHRATDLRDFTVRPGDLFLAMEVRQARELRRRLGARDDVEVVLLGLWCAPRRPHLHDPYTLSDAYFDQCFSRVRAAVHALRPVVPQACRARPADIPR